MSYYYNRRGILQKAKERYSKQQTAEYSLENKEEESQKINTKACQKKKKTR